MKSLKAITLLNSIPKISIYSNYGINLERIFEKHSLGNLIKTLKFKKDYINQMKKESTEAIKINEEYDIFEKQKKDKARKEENEIDIFSLPVSKSEPKLKIQKKHIKNYFFIKKNKVEFDSNSLAYKYYPNFNSIDKNVPSVRIIKPNFIDKLNKKYNIFNQEIKKKINNDDSIKEMKKNNDKKKDINIFINDNQYLNTINNYKSFKYPKNIKNKIINFRNNNSQSTNNKSNNSKKSLKSIEATHRFKTEIPLKTPKKPKSKLTSNDKLPCLSSQKDEEIINNNSNNITPFHYKNRAIDFTKMKSHKFLNLKNIEQMPDFCSYEPKYNLVEKRQYNIFFNKLPENDKSRKKRNLLNKILTSYEVESNYQTIDNNKLNNDILLKYRFSK